MAIDREFLQQRSAIASNIVLAALHKIQTERNAAIVEAVAEANGYDSDYIPTNVEVSERGFPPAEKSGLIPEGFVLDDSQQRAVEILTQHPQGCLIGAAGTGKTSIMRVLVHELVYKHEVIQKPSDVAFVSFTGTAAQVMAKNMPPWLRSRCMTIHSLLEFAPVEAWNEEKQRHVWRFEPRRDFTNPLQVKVIFIDETSMVGTPLYEQLKDAMRKGTRTYAIGDLNQLPPIGGSSSFGFMLAEWKVAELTTIHRQKDPKAQAIIECAHAILNGKTPDMPEDDLGRFVSGDWAVWGFELKADPDQAARQIIGLLNKVKDIKTPEGEEIYNPHRDRVMTPGNGYDPTMSAASIQQAPLNRELAPYFDPPNAEHPIIVIDAGASTKEFAIGFRVMATKNEPPDTKNRVTNGMLGRIVEIEPLLAYDGDRGLVGPKDQVSEEKKSRINKLFGREVDQPLPKGSLFMPKAEDITGEGMRSLASQMANAAENESTGRFSGPASHQVTIDFENGSRRIFVSQAQVDTLQLAYVTTVAKAQGAQHETAIVVIHHANKAQLCRELLYTAVTRASRRVIILYTPFGLNLALSKQRIKGRTLEEKIDRYRKFLAMQREEA